ncbi:terminase large subunit [Mangrovicoccus ximenensis]|uniref:terminase large subunit n=1 Tax=Mangrovicoccus ximenensis TaxID=1911570 RepID=UPI000D3A0EB5|nr:terminase TerL endonuclease subunit [Mangrovicoccus ximenensis]
MQPIDHAVSRYALDVAEGRVVAGELVRLACERHLRDLEEGAARGLVFDCGAADMIIRFAAMIRHSEGSKAGQPFILEPWQVFRMGSVFGWKHEDTGLRRFRDTYHQVGKKNGKTTDTAVPMLYTQLLDGEAAPQGYCAATTRDQAGLLFKGLKRALKRSPLLSRGFAVYKYEIEQPDTDGVMKCLSRDGDSSDGINPHFLARDELHRWTDRELAETIRESMIARAQPIDWAITTAGHDRNGSICGELRTYAEKVLRGGHHDDSLFAYVAEPPADCDPMDPAAWAMGNPNLGVSKPLSAVRKAGERAQVITAEMPNFRRFHLNLWTEGAEAWIASDSWNRGGADAAIDPRTLYGRRAWVGLDLSDTTDTTAVVVAVPVGEEVHLLAYVFIAEGPSGFIHRAQTECREYIGWQQEGWLEVHPGGNIDRGEVKKRLKWIKSAFDVQEVAYDPWRMAEMAKELEAAGLPMVEHRQGFASMSRPMQRVEELVADRRLRHGGNPVLAQHVGNTHRDEDASLNIKPNKKRSRGRIDAAVAMIMAVGRATLGEGRIRARELETL